MDLKELHRPYGRLMINLEIIQGKIQECKRNIVNEMNKPKGRDDGQKNRADEGRAGGIKRRDKVQDKGSLPA